MQQKLSFLSCLIGFVLVFVGCGQPPLSPRDPSDGVFHFRVMTFNLEIEKRPEASTIAAVGQPDADVLCLQEVGWGWPDVLRTQFTKRYPHQLFYADPNHPTGGLAVLSHYPLKDLGVEPDPEGWHPSWRFSVMTPRGALEILNVHLRPVFSGDGNAVSSYVKVGDDHRAQIDRFHPSTGSQARLIMGDFNEDPNGAAIQRLEDQGYSNVLPMFHPGQQTWRHKSLGGQFDATIDHILFDEQLDPLNAWVLVKGKSDHLPVIADFEWPVLPQPTQPTPPPDTVTTAP